MKFLIQSVSLPRENRMSTCACMCLHVCILGVGGESHAGGEHKGKWGERRKLGKGLEQSPQAHGQQLPSSRVLPFFLEIMDGALGSKSWLFGLVPISDWKLLPLSSSGIAKLKRETLATGRFLRSRQNVQPCSWFRQLGMSPMTVMETGLWSDGGSLKPFLLILPVQPGADCPVSLNLHALVHEWE